MVNVDNGEDFGSEEITSLVSKRLTQDGDSQVRRPSRKFISVISGGEAGGTSPPNLPRATATRDSRKQKLKNIEFGSISVALLIVSLRIIFSIGYNTLEQLRADTGLVDQKKEINHQNNGKIFR